VVDQDKILAITMGLPPSYKGIIIALDSTPTEQLLLEEVIPQLRNEEVRQTSVYSAHNPPSTSTPDPGVAAAMLSKEKPWVDR
ncbi:hypothetical protein OH76DRAFT_1366597, partial [Lentinus brumalis]